MKSALVIGTGVTGLATAATLKKAGVHVRVLEKAPRPGGAIQSVQRDGFLVERGPHSLMVNSLNTAMLLGELGLSDKLLLPNDAAKNRYLLKGGEMVPVPMGPGKFLKSPLLSCSGKFRLLREPFIKRPCNLAEESLAAFVERRLGREVLDQMAEPFVSGIYAGDPERLSARHAFPALDKLEREHGSLIKGAMKAGKSKPAGSFKPVMASFQGGMHTLIEALAAQLGQDLECNCVIKSITHGDRWTVTWERDGETREYVADELILAAPAFSLRKLPLPQSVLDSIYDLHEIPYPPVTSFSLGYRREQIAHALDGFGVLVPSVENRRVLGVLFPSAFFPHRAPEDHVLLTAFLGGMRQPDVAQLPEAEQLALLKGELADIVGAFGEPVFSERSHWERAIPQYQVGHGDFMAMCKKAEATHPGLHLCGNYRGGIAVGQCLSNGVALGREIAAQQQP